MLARRLVGVRTGGVLAIGTESAAMVPCKLLATSVAIIHDDEETIRNKIIRGFCPLGTAENNPILELMRYVVFHEYDEIIIERPQKYGGSVVYATYKELEREYVQRKIHAMDLKNATAKYLNQIIEPVRNHFKGREPKLN